MGKLADALKPQSSYAAKKTPLWDEVTDRIAGAILLADLEEIEVWLEFNELLIPFAWRPPLTELLEKRRDELEAEDIGLILREKFDFT